MFQTNFDANEKIWSGPDADSNIDKTQNFGEIILQKLNDVDSNRVMQIDGDTGEGLTKAEVYQRTIRFAQNLMRLGCSSEHRIGIVAQNHQNLTPLLFAAFCIGSPISPMDVLMVEDGVPHLLKRVKPQFIFCDATVLLSVKSTIDSIGLNAKLFTVNGTIDGFDTIDSLMSETDNEDTLVCARIDDSSSHVAIIACSSGSTGIPKSISISHALLTYAHTKSIGKSEFDGVLTCFSSLYWTSGTWSLIKSAFKFTRVFTSKPFSAKLFCDLVEKHKIALFLGPPCQIQAIAKVGECLTESNRLSSLRLLFSIGGYVPSILVETLKKTQPQCIFITTYGTTETGGGVSATKPMELDEHPNSVGHLVPGIKVKVVHEKSQQNCGIDEEGEIFVKSPIPIRYYLDDEANKLAFDEDGYYATGDIGYFDANGRLYISGRKKEIFRVRNFGVKPSEIEDILMKSPAIENATAVNVFDDEQMTELAAAVIIKNERYTITEDEIYAMVAENLAEYKWLDGGVYFVDKFPMTPSGKVIRSKVKETAQSFFDTRKKVQTKSMK